MSSLCQFYCTFYTKFIYEAFKIFCGSLNVNEKQHRFQNQKLEIPPQQCFQKLQLQAFYNTFNARHFYTHFDNVVGVILRS